ncbi:MAG: serine/threonine-protein kinase [Planctomycetota bacterium]
MNPADDAHSEILFALHEEIARCLRDGAPIVPTELAGRFALSLDEVERSIVGVRALLAMDLVDARAEAAAPPRLPDDFELLGELGRGGMGVVYKARQRSLDRVIAIKVLPASDLSAGDLLRRFHKEARSLARLRHPHIVSIHEVGETEGLLYFTMDFIDGVSLSEIVRRGEITPARAVRLLRQVASAIAYSHGQGVVHRDLKPANILVDRNGDAFVVDFGLAREVDGRGDLTLTGQILGTPAYMSPEQARGDGARIGESSDVYALGAILYECLTGGPPHTGRGLAEVVHAVLHVEPIAPQRVRPDVPRDLEIVCLKAMAKDPAQRYSTANALLEDLERFHDGRPIRARAPSLGYRIARLARRHARALGIGSVLAAALIAVFVAVVLPQVRPAAASTLAAAKELLERGEHRAASVLLDRARGQGGTPEVLEDIHRSAVTADLALLRTELSSAAPDLAAGRKLLEDATTDAIAAIGDAPRAEVVEQAWALAARAAAAKQDEVVKASTEVVGRILTARRAIDADKPNLLRMAMAMATKDTGDPRELLGRLLPALRDAADPLHAVATNFAVEHLLDASPHDEVITWLCDQARRDPAILRPFVAELDGLSDERRDPLIRILSGRRDDDTLARLVLSRAVQPLLAGLASDTALRPIARTVAADLLAASADLPVRAPRAEEYDAVPQSAPEIAAPIVALWRELDGLDRIAAFERRVAAAVAAPQLDSPVVRRWLDDHTLGTPGSAFLWGSAAQWRRWWESAAKVDPRDRLAQGLGLSTAQRSDVPALLDRLLHSYGRERAGLHHLLALTIPTDATVPFWPWSDRVPADLPMEWWRLARGDAAVPSFALHVAAIDWRDGDPEPTLAWETAQVVALGETVQPQSIASLAPLSIAFDPPRVPGVDVDATIDPGQIEERMPELQVRWTTRREIELVPQSRDAALRVRRIHASINIAAMAPVREGSACVALRTDMPVWFDGRGGQRVLCVMFESAATASSLGFDGWRARVAASLHRLPTDFWRVPQTDNCDFGALGDAADAVELASLIPVPEARDDLRRLTLDVPNHSPIGSDDFSRRVTRARLLLGDVQALELDPAHLVARLPRVDAAQIGALADTRYWSHVAGRSGDERLRSEALGRMHVGLLPERRVWLAPDAVAVPSLIALVGAAIAIGLAAVAVLRRRRPGPFVTGFVVTAGVMTVMFGVRIDGIAVLPAAVGYLLCALGLRALSDAQGSRLRIGTWLLLAAAVFETGATLRLAPSLLRLLATSCFAAAWLGLPWSLRGGRAALPHAKLWNAVALLGLCAYAFGALPSLFGEARARLFFGMPAWSFWGEARWQWARQAVPLCGLCVLLVHAIAFRTATRRVTVRS